ncbi:MAG: NAD(P)/FAD-dependent oxidoreductase [Planctomycetes bacterium]|nr:NAD(P)/FAD-dependent oxidoreductase [Planctomycetota bacterium]
MSDAIVVGGGVDGLVCAAALARAGRQVTLLERRSVLGGLASRDEFAPGCFAPGVLHDTRGLRDDVVRSLQLGAHGLRRRAAEAPVVLPLASDRALFRHADDALMRDQLLTHSAADADAWTRWRRTIARLRPFVGSLFDAPAPDPEADTLPGLLGLLKTGLDLRRLGKDAMLELLRIAPMASADWLKDTFRDESLATLLAAPALHGTWLGPWAAGTALALLVNECSAGASVVGGRAALADACASSARVSGVDIRLGHEVTGLVVEHDRVGGVVLASGAELVAPVVVLACDVVRALRTMLPRDVLPQRLQKRLSGWRARGALARLDLVLDGPLELPCARGLDVERALLGARCLDDLERAADALKYRALPERPWLDLAVPSLDDPSLAPPGQTIVSALVHGVAHDLDGGWTDAAREQLVQRVVSVLGEFAPSAPARIRASRLLAPPDLEARYAIAGGHVLHGEFALDQVLPMRPDPDLARGRTPIEGLRLCGRAVHPGPFAPGTSGLLAARALGK